MISFLYGLIGDNSGASWCYWLTIIGLLSVSRAVFSCIPDLLLFLHLDKAEKKEIEEYIATLSYRVKKVGEEALMEMPIGIMLINDDYYIEWTNPFLASCFAEDTLDWKITI